MSSLALKAFYFGIISAVSLPLGAIVARFWTPSKRITAVLMAFGGGALLAALSIDLVAKAVHEKHFMPLIIGCIVGGILYEILNQIVNYNGGFLRKTATTINHLKLLQKTNMKIVMRKLSSISFFHQLDNEEIHSLIPFIKSKHYKKGETIIKQNEDADAFYVIVKGEVDILKNNEKIANFKKEDIFGEVELIKEEKHAVTAIASQKTNVFYIQKKDFNTLLSMYPHFASEVKKYILNHSSEIKEKEGIDVDKAESWMDRVMTHVDEEITAHTNVNVKEAVKVHGGAALAIWLGIFLDGIPESLVIGSSLLYSTMSLSLLGGLFLSNFPEALSSSVGMKSNGFSNFKILMMWTSLMIFTGIGALLGNIFLAHTSHKFFILIEGMAAGAMLTMIAETMLPEAFHMGGWISGISTLLGFLSAIGMKMFE